MNSSRALAKRHDGVTIILSNVVMNMPSFISRLAARHPLARDLTPVLVIKLVLIVLASVFLFGSVQRVHVDPTLIAHKLFDSSPGR
jgi:hypothetical protein